MMTRKILIGICLLFTGILTKAQNGLENIVVERYYVSVAADSLVSVGILPVGSVTYRVYADMLPGYKFQAAYGTVAPAHTLTINTTTSFFNNEDWGGKYPTFNKTKCSQNTVMLDSWLSAGAGCAGNFGVYKTEDNGVATVTHPAGVLANVVPQMGIGLWVQDGLLMGTPEDVTSVGEVNAAANVFDGTSQAGNSFVINDGAWSALNGATGPTATNRVLIGQFTTDGIFHFELNIQIGTPSLGAENYVAANSTGAEISIPSLIQTFYPNPLPPTVSITTPTDGANFAVGAPVAITANATDIDGSVTQVEFFVDGTSIGIDTSTPYEAVYTGLSAASHILTATATDNDGQATTSAPVNINITPLSRNVTFIVDMSKETISSNGVHLAGSLNNWNPSATTMTAGSDDVYSATVTLTEGQEYMYMFVNGNSNTGLEFVPAECGVPNGSGLINRVVIVPTNDTILDTVCFAMCSHCPVDIPVTFSVDMTYQTVSANGVHLAGSFNGWNTYATPMVASANNIYSATLMLTPGTYQVYRFVNGNETVGYENVPAECGSPSASGGFDRYLTIPGADTTLNPVCFSSCVACGGSAQYVNVTFKVDMHHESVSTNGVHIAGSFQGWQPGSTAMMTSGDTVYSYTQSFLSGSAIEYRFVNGITSNDFETVPAACAMNGNRFLTIPSADTVLNLVCFSSCEACVPQSTVNVTFRVDIAQTTVSSEGVHLAGSFQGWNPSSTVMSGTGNIYSVSLQLPANTIQEYKFVNGVTLNESEIVPLECSLNGNRFFTGTNDTILQLVCFAKCGICDVAITENIDKETEISIYPNPFSEIAFLNLNLPKQGFVKVQVFNPIGQLITTTAAGEFVSGNHWLEINGNGLTPGFYYCTVTYTGVPDSFVRTLKIIRK